MVSTGSQGSSLGFTTVTKIILGQTLKLNILEFSQISGLHSFTVLQSLNVIRKLSDKTIQSEEDALHVIELLQKQGPPVVVLSSSNLGDSTSLTGYASCKHGEN